MTTPAQAAPAAVSENGTVNTPSPNSPEAVAANPALDQNGNPKSTQTYPVNGGAGVDDKGRPIQGDPNTEATVTPTTEVPSTPARDAPVKFSEDHATQIGEFLNTAGIDTAKLVKEVTDTGKVPPEALAMLVKEHGEAVGALVAQQLTQLAIQRKSEVAANDKAVYDTVAEAFKDTTDQSGAETWKELSTWAKDNISAEHRTEINSLLQGGGLKAELATRYLVDAFKASDAFSRSAVLETGNPATAEGFKAISKQEYSSKLRELQSKGHVYGQSQEIARLDAQRSKSIKRGF